jgi:hypothetical protein
MDLWQACTVLGVQPSTPLDEARTRYRMRAQMLHPDRAEPALRSEAERAMAQLTEAWALYQQIGGDARDDQSDAPPPTDAQNVPRGPVPGECYLCGRYPAGLLRLSKGQGLVIFRRRTDFAGEVCRDCGLSVFREYQASTLAWGWWGLIAFFANFAYVIGNWQSVSGLLHRVPTPAGRDPAVVSPLPPGLPISNPVLRRLSPLLGCGLVVTAVATIAVLAISTSDGESSPPQSSPVGQCLTADGRVADCSQGTAVYKIVDQVPDTSSCPESQEVFTSSAGVFCAVTLP